jgi:hypothetical protein
VTIDIFLNSTAVDSTVWLRNKKPGILIVKTQSFIQRLKTLLHVD